MRSAAPQRDVLFHCALGLSVTSADEDAELAVSIFQSLLHSSYLRFDCHLALARLYARQGFVVRARRSLQVALAEDPHNPEAVQFQAEFDDAVKRDGKLAIYGLLIVGAAMAILCAYRQGRGHRGGAHTALS